ncbi:GTPase-associated protein 1-related protein, partial [Streptomyces sp. NPDC055078]
AAARGAQRHGRGRAADFWGPLLVTLAEGGDDPRTPGEWLALAPIADQLARIAGHPAIELLTEELLAALATAGRAPLDLVLALLDLADELSVDTTGVLPVLAERASAALLNTAPGRGGDTAGVPAALSAVLGRHPAIRAAVVSALDLAAAAPDTEADTSNGAGGGTGRGTDTDTDTDTGTGRGAGTTSGTTSGGDSDAVRLAAVVRIAVPDADLTAAPHLRMGEAAAHRPAGEDPVGAFHALVAAAGPGHKGRATVLRTAHRLVWGDRTLTPGDGRLLINELPRDWLGPSGIEAAVTRAALSAPADDPDAPALADDLLRYATRAIDPRTRSALGLLVIAGRLADGTAAPGFTERSVLLCRTAQPLEEAIAERIGRAVARALLAAHPPAGELEQLAHSQQPELLSGYRAVAAGDTIRAQLRVSPPFIATCFIHWSSGRGLNPAWEETRTALLADVLRPVVRKLPPEYVADVVRELAKPGGGWVGDFQEWNRPGRIGRLGRQLLRRKQSDTGHGSPPGEERRR